MTEDWEWTDDPEDPCALCVNFGDGDIPYVAPGVKAQQLYRGIHRECEAKVLAYQEESGDV